MRLIDADKITFFNCLAKTGNAVCCHAEGITSKLGIEMQPTVNAIPIEFIKQQLEKEEYRTFLVDYIEWGSCLHWLIEVWEKENGRSE